MVVNVLIKSTQDFRDIQCNSFLIKDGFLIIDDDVQRVYIPVGDIQLMTVPKPKEN